MVIEDAGDCRFRSFDLSFLRNLCGTRSCIDRHGTCRGDFKNVPCCLSFHDGKAVDITDAASGKLITTTSFEVDGDTEKKDV